MQIRKIIIFLLFCYSSLYAERLLYGFDTNELNKECFLKNSYKHVKTYKPKRNKVFDINSLVIEDRLVFAYSKSNCNLLVALYKENKKEQRNISNSKQESIISRFLKNELNDNEMMAIAGTIVAGAVYYTGKSIHKAINTPVNTSNDNGVGSESYNHNNSFKKTYKVYYNIKSTQGVCYEGRTTIKFVNTKTGESNSELGGFFGNDGIVELEQGEYKITCYGGMMSDDVVLGRIYVGEGASNEFRY
jgi:hypothetical protein